MREVLRDEELPPWLLEKIERERAMFAGTAFPSALGSPGYRVAGPTARGEWLWDNGTGGVLVFSQDGALCTNYGDLPVTEQDRISAEFRSAGIAP